MGQSYGQFTKFPRTPHLFGSTGTDDDKHLSNSETTALLADDSLIVEEKIDGTNVGIHFAASGELVLQCRGHLISEGMHPQYDLFKQWAVVKQLALESILEDRYLLFGEWMYARHSIHYLELTHYFFEFDIYDKQTERFLDLETRQSLLAGSGVQSVPILHRGAISAKRLLGLIGKSRFGARFENPMTQKTDDLMEGLYLKTESDGAVTARGKYVRPEFTEKIKQSTHWQQQVMVPNRLADGVDLWTE